jgi:cyclopropane-fatty-acyl-phospholipid synthase
MVSVGGRGTAAARAAAVAGALRSGGAALARGAVGDPRALVDAVVDRGRLPDPVLRATIRGLLGLRRGEAGEGEAALRARLWAGPVTVGVDDANAQHYEVPPRVFELMLGPRLKYSCAWWPEHGGDLAEAEDRMLDLTCRRAGLADGQDVLELGCGWGSLTLWMAERYPSSRILAVSNSTRQRAHITAAAHERGLDNVRVVTADVGTLGVGETPAGFGSFDRVVSVEMLEHVRNHRELGRRIARWLRPGGELFVHVFAHRDRTYLFETGGAGDWMARHFFTGGTMPSEDLIPAAMDALEHRQTWRVDGRQYTRTLAAWRENLEDRRDEVVAELSVGATRTEGERRWHRWRTFLVACEELFAARDGSEWGVVHHRLVRPA